jgi:hypothetical protein
MNHLNDTRNMIVMLIVPGIITAAAIVTLIAVPSILKSNADLAGQSNNNNDTNDGSSSSNVLIPRG